MVLGICLDLLHRALLHKGIDIVAVPASLSVCWLPQGLFHPYGHYRCILARDAPDLSFRLRTRSIILGPNHQRHLCQFESCVVSYTIFVHNSHLS